MSYSRTCGRLAGSLLLLCAPAYLNSQSSPTIEKLAEQTARDIENTHGKVILIAPQEGCLLVPALCAQFESELRGDLAKTNADAQFITREELIKLAKSHGLLAIDAYDKRVLVNLASGAGAATLVTGNLVWEGGDFELRSETYLATTGQIAKHRVTKVSASLSGDDPLVYPDPESGTALIIPKRKTAGFRLFRFPECKDCRMPDPWKSDGPLQFVSLLMTITAEGTMEQIVVVESSSEKTTEKTLEAIKGWRYKPAIGSDGKPFSARILVTMDLTPPLCPAALPERGDPPAVHIGPPAEFQPCPVLPRYYPQNLPGQF